MAIIKRTTLAKTDLNAESDTLVETTSTVKYIDKIVKDGVEYEIHAANSGSGSSGKRGLSRFITFDNQFMDFSWNGEEGNYVSVVGQIKHGHGRRRIKNYTHGLLNNLEIPTDNYLFDRGNRRRSDQYFGTHSRNSFSLFNTFKDESYKLDIPNENYPEAYQYIDYIMSYILQSTNFTSLTPAEFVPVYHCWGANEVVHYVQTHMNVKEFQPINLYQGLFDSWDGWDKVPGRFYMEPIDEQNIESNPTIGVFGLNVSDFVANKNNGKSNFDSKRISVKFIKNLYLNIKDIGTEKYNWSGEMNFAGLFIRARFQKINNQWYIICYVCPEIVEKSRY